MKIILLLLVAFAAQSYGQDILECFAPALDNVSADRADVQEWAVDVRETAGRLQDQRQRCADIPRDDPPTALQDRIIQACSAAWSASVAYELNRLHSNLVEIDPELAGELRSSAADCFPTGSRHYYARVLKNVF